MSREMRGPARGASLVSLALAGLAMLPGASRAACELRLSPGKVDFGKKVSGSLPHADVAGYRLLGQATLTLAGSCAQAQGRIRISLETPPGPGRDLSPWANPANVGAALAIMLTQASVGTEVVPVILSDQPGVARSGPVALAAANVLELDMSALRPDANRRIFALSLRISGLLPDTYATGTETSFRAAPVFSLVQ